MGITEISALICGCSCGNIGEPGILGKCKQFGALFITPHALISIKICKQCHKFHGNRLSFGSPWRLLIRRLLHYLPHLPVKCSHWISGKYSTTSISSLPPTLPLSLSLLYFFQQSHIFFEIYWFPYILAWERKKGFAWKKETKWKIKVKTIKSWVGGLLDKCKTCDFLLYMDLGNLFRSYKEAVWLVYTILHHHPSLI